MVPTGARAPHQPLLHSPEERPPAREIWSRFLDFLADHGASGSLILIVIAIAIVTLVIAAFAFWLALALRDAPPEPAADMSAEM